MFISGPSFPDIHGPEDPEEFFWRTEISEELELRQIDDRTVGVFYPDDLRAFTIEAEPAHDAVGSTVPTTLAVSEGDVVIVVVHHREGNLAAGGAPFVYPITGGVGWEGGYRTVSFPLTESAPAPTPAPSSTPAAEPFAIPCKQPHAEGLRLLVEPKSCVLVGTAAGLDPLTLVLRRLEWIGWGSPVARAKGFSEELVGERRPVRLRAYGASPCDGELRYGMARFKPAGQRWRRIRLAPCPV